MDAERWLPVVGYEGRYEVSDFGRIRTVARTVQRVYPNGSIRFQRLPQVIMKQVRTGGTWYARVKLHKDGKYKCVSVHTLVLTAFVCPRPRDKECCHGDGDKGNNKLENLSWGTHEENEADKLRHGSVLRGEQIEQARLTTSDVIEIRKRHQSSELQCDLAHHYSVSKATINRIIKRKTWRHVA